MEGAEQTSYPPGAMRPDVTSYPPGATTPYRLGDAELAASERIAPRVFEHLTELEHQIELLAREVARLEDRIEPVLVPPSPHAIPDPLVGDEMLESPVARAVAGSWARLDQLRRRLTSLTDRVEV